MDGVVLVFRGVLLVVRGHAHVLRCLNQPAGVGRSLWIARHEKNDPVQKHEAAEITVRVIASTR